MLGGSKDYEDQTLRQAPDMDDSPSNSSGIYSISECTSDQLQSDENLLTEKEAVNTISYSNILKNEEKPRTVFNQCGTSEPPGTKWTDDISKMVLRIGCHQESTGTNNQVGKQSELNDDICEILDHISFSKCYRAKRADVLKKRLQNIEAFQKKELELHNILNGSFEKEIDLLLKERGRQRSMNLKLMGMERQHWTEKVSEVQRDLKNANGKIASHNLEIQRRKKKISNFELKLKQQADQILDLDEELKTKKNELNNADQTIEDLNRKLNWRKAKIKQLEAEKKLFDQDTINQLEIEKEKFKNELFAAGQKINELEAENSMIKRKSRSDTEQMVQLESVKKNLETDVREMNSKFHQLTVENQEVEKKVNWQNTMICHLQKEQEGLESKLNSKEKSLTYLNVEKGTLQNELQRAKKKIEQLEREQGILQSELKRKETKCMQLDTDRNILAKRSTSISRELKALKQYMNWNLVLDIDVCNVTIELNVPSVDSSSEEEIEYVPRMAPIDHDLLEKVKPTAIRKKNEIDIYVRLIEGGLVKDGVVVRVDISWNLLTLVRAGIASWQWLLCNKNEDGVQIQKLQANRRINWVMGVNTSNIAQVRSVVVLKFGLNVKLRGGLFSQKISDYPDFLKNNGKVWLLAKEFANVKPARSSKIRYSQRFWELAVSNKNKTGSSARIIPSENKRHLFSKDRRPVRKRVLKPRPASLVLPPWYVGMMSPNPEKNNEPHLKALMDHNQREVSVPLSDDGSDCDTILSDISKDSKVARCTV